MSEPNYAADMSLPDWLTCADCRHGWKCDALFGAVRLAFTSCDFWPSLFSPCANAPVPAQSEASQPLASDGASAVAGMGSQS